MPITRILPDSADDSGGDLDPNVGAGWQALSDASDATYVSKQLSATEPTKHLEGGYADMPVGVGRVNSAQLGVRAYTDLTASCSLVAMTDTLTTRISVPVLADVVTTYLSAAITDWTVASQINALGWGLRVDFIAHDGVQGIVTELWLDVDWDPAISGFRGMITSFLGPMVAIGLADMPGIAREVFRRSRTRIRPDEYAAAWRELRDDRAARHFLLGV